MTRNCKSKRNLLIGGAFRRRIKIPYAPQRDDWISVVFFCVRREASINAPSLRATKTTSPSARSAMPLRLLTRNEGLRDNIYLLKTVSRFGCAGRVPYAPPERRLNFSRLFFCARREASMNALCQSAFIQSIPSFSKMVHVGFRSSSSENNS